MGQVRRQVRMMREMNDKKDEQNPYRWMSM